MTTKIKIIFGFALTILLLLALAVVGYLSLGNSTENFSKYDRMARLNVAMSDLSAYTYNTAYNLERFLGGEADRGDRAVAQSRLALAASENSLGYFISPDRLAEARQMSAKLKDYSAGIEQFKTGTTAFFEEYRRETAPAMKALLGTLESMLGNAAAAGNTQVVVTMSDLFERASELNAALSGAYQRLNQPNAMAADQAMTEFRKTMEALKTQMSSPQARRDIASLEAAFNRLSTSFDTIQKHGTASVGVLNKSYEISAEVIAYVQRVNSDVDAEMDKFGLETVSENEQAQTTMLGISVGGVAAGLVFAILIIVALIRVLTRVSEYAGAVAHGNFAYDPKITEKGEIGSMVGALRQIPQIFQEVVGHCNATANRIASGQLRDRLDEGALAGDFKNLARAVNTVSDSYTKVIDDLPISVMAADNERKIQFLNSMAQKVAGGNSVGVFCGDKLNAGVCKNEQTCLGKRSMQAKSVVSEESTVDLPDGNKLHLAINSSPLYDLSGKMAGCMEIVSDVTQIRQQEITMRNVANQASEISDRVAAAAEELSAQVEQVSRGAEMQRDRVDSTASAMTEMNSTVLEVARSAGQASEQSEGTKTNAEAGSELVGKVVQAINGVNEVAQRLQQNMTELGRQADSIGGVMNVISDIADQTNLLALNAAIEAARAGEVRKLAEKTMTATHEVGANISAIQQAAAQNIEAMGGAVEGVTAATELANNSGASLHQIVELATATSNVVASIATAAEEQSATSDEITRAIEEVNQVVAETAEGMVQASAAVQDLSRMAQELRNVMESLR